MNEHLNWSDIRVFLAVAQGGSLSAAAKALGQSQPTIGRRVQVIEDRLGQPLFDRHARGLRLTEYGAQLLPHAKEMHAASAAFALAAQSADLGARGTVRITAPVFMSHYILPEFVASFRREHPEIEIEISASDAQDNLLFREADIALRTYESTQLDIVTKRLGGFRLCAAAAHSYLHARGTPQTVEDLGAHDFVGYDRNDLILRVSNELGWPLTRSDFSTRCDNQAIYYELVRQGAGIGFVQHHIAIRDDLVHVIDLDLVLPTLPVWLAAHDALLRVKRVRLVWQALEKAISSMTAREH